MNSAKVKELNKRLAHEEATYWRLSQQQRAYRATQKELRIIPIEHQIAQEALNLFNDELLAANARINAAQAALDEAMIAASRAGTGWLPEGTKVYEWGRGRWGNREPAKTGAVGVVEVWTEDSVYPDNDRSTPSAGCVVVRLLKKDGTPSKKYINVTNYAGSVNPYMTDWWLPEGVAPATKKE